MTFLVLGINHQSAPVQLRERVAFDDASMTTALSDLQKQFVIREAVILSTCNRTEIYCYCGEALQAIVLCQWLEAFHGLPSGTIQESIYFYKDRDVIHHIMCVASGLNSQVLGETQIQSQMKNALAQSQDSGMAQGILGRLFAKSFMLAKQVRHQTEIGQYSVSVAYTAVCLAKQVFEKISTSSVMLIGSGETIDTVANHLYERGVMDVCIANRTLKNAQVVADKVGGTAVTLNDIPAQLPQADIVICATASRVPLIGKSLVEQALKQRRQRPMLLIDLAVPRDIAPDVGTLEDAYLYTVDDLNKIVEKNLKHREYAATQAQVHIDAAVDDFLAWYRSLESGQLIAELRAQAQQITEQETRRASEKLARGVCAEQVMAELTHKITNKLLHAPTKALHHAGKAGRKDILAYLTHMLNTSKSSD